MSVFISTDVDFLPSETLMPWTLWDNEGIGRPSESLSLRRGSTFLHGHKHESLALSEVKITRIATALKCKLRDPRTWMLESAWQLMANDLDCFEEEGRTTLDYHTVWESVPDGGAVLRVFENFSFKSFWFAHSIMLHKRTQTQLTPLQEERLPSRLFALRS